jgi:hypothetical protein
LEDENESVVSAVLDIHSLTLIKSSVLSVINSLLNDDVVTREAAAFELIRITHTITAMEMDKSRWLQKKLPQSND